MIEIYCLPGTMCDQRLWDSTQAALGQNVVLRPIAIPMEDSIELIVRVLADVLPQQSIYLLGFSMGGYVAGAFASQYPQRVRRLMVVSNTSTGLLAAERRQREVALDWVQKQGYRGLPRKKAQAMLGDNHKSNELILGIMKSMDKALGERILIQQLKSSLDRPDLLSYLEQTHLPICFAVGKEDVLMPTSALERIESNEHFDLNTAEQCGHMLPLEQPIWLSALIHRFYAEETNRIIK